MIIKIIGSDKEYEQYLIKQAEAAHVGTGQAFSS